MTEENPLNGEFQLPLRVYIEDTDAGGIVYYVNYLKYMERARTEYLRSLGYQQQLLAEQNLLFVVHSAEVRYRQPAQLDQLLHVSAKLQQLNKASLVFSQQVQHDQRLLCQAQIKVACVQRDTLRPRPLPEALYQAFHHSL